MYKRFKNKTVVITGGAGGLATALIQKLLASGANVAALDLHIDNITNSEQLLSIEVDLTQRDDLQTAITKIVGRFGGVDILFNNAGITHMSQFESTSIEVCDAIMAVNFTASIDITRLCLPYLKQTKGQIVAISSVAGFAPLYGRSVYSASKHAMEGFFRSLACEVKDDGISVLIVSPSFVKSRPELNAQVNNGISSPGAMKKNTNGEQMSPHVAAEKILKATAVRQSALYLGKVSKAARLLQTVVPKLYLKLMVNNAKKEFE
jgi:NAD(P)-dependent dehydrogenase (short-subunit alcohol dehydrogenase family)